MVSGGDFDIVHLAGGGRGGQALQAHAFKMEFDGAANFGLDLIEGRARRHSAREIGYVSAEVAAGIFDHDGVTHDDLTS